MFHKEIRRINRYRDIAMAMINQGFGYIVAEIGLIKWLPFSERLFPAYVNNTKSLGERVRLVLEALGPTYIKLGQIASTHQELFPAEISRELEKLQDQAASFPFAEVSRIIQAELGAPLEEIFQQFELTPLAAASIGQVHRGLLKTGEPVAIKVQRPGIATIIETDLEILYHLVNLVERRFKWAENYRISAMLAEFAKALRNELDYTIEARNTKKIAAQPNINSYFYIPKVFSDYSTNKVLTTEYLTGIKINEIDRLKQQGYNLPDLAQRFVQGLLQQIFSAGFFHGDPHPGNVIILPNGALGLLDFGMVGRLSPEIRYHLASMIIALIRHDPEGIIKAVLALGIVPENVNLRQLKDDLEQLQEQFYEVPLSQLSLGNLVRQIVTVLFKHQIKLPADLTLLGKTLITLEGLTKKLDPQFSVIKAAEPLGQRLLLERWQPKQVIRKIWNNTTALFELFLSFPKQFKELSSFIRQGRLRLEVALPDLDPFFKKQERIMNRLSLCIILLSLCIMMAGVIIGLSFSRQTTVLTNPIVEVGFGIALAMFLWIFYAIIRSGGL